MAMVLFAVVVAVASLVPANSLTCNNCTWGLLGYCLSSSDQQCSTNTSQCFTGKLTFTALSSVGINTQGCTEPAGCNMTANSTVYGIGFEYKEDCCSTDKCNPTTVSAAPPTRATFAALVGAAILASAVGSSMGI